jgi:hypothetical protein
VDIRSVIKLRRLLVWNVKSYLDLRFVFIISSITIHMASVAVSILVAVFFTICLLFFALFCLVVISFTQFEWREDDPCHFKLLCEAELFIQAFGSFIFMSDNDEWTVASFYDQSSEILCQVNAVAKNKYLLIDDYVVWGYYKQLSLLTLFVDALASFAC